MNAMPNLVLTAILDSHVSRQWRSCGKLWAASLLRHQWKGAIRIARNFPQPLFPVARTDLREADFVPPLGKATTKVVKWKSLAREHQLAAAGRIAVAEEYDWILLADADCIAIRNLDHLFVGEGDLLVSRSGSVPDPGFVAVRGSRLPDFVKGLRAAGGLTEAGLAAVVQSDTWKVREFERGEVLRPNDTGVTLADLAQAAVIHFSGMKEEEKHQLAFAFHMMAVYGDADGLFFDMMES